MGSLPASIEYDLDDVHLSTAERERIERHLSKWTTGHTDITGAAFALRRTESSATAHEFTARLVLYHRPGNIAARSTGENKGAALHNVLAATERQLRTQREIASRRRRAAGTPPLTEE